MVNDCERRKRGATRRQSKVMIGWRSKNGLTSPQPGCIPHPSFFGVFVISTGVRSRGRHTEPGYVSLSVYSALQNPEFPLRRIIVSRISAVARVLAFVSCLFWISAPAWGQDTGSLQGTVTDPAGAAVSGANIVATSRSSSVTHSTTSTSTGSYGFTQLAPGDYKVEISKTGFKTFVQARLSILVATPRSEEHTSELQ